jgi:hypothetical protein
MSTKELKQAMIDRIMEIPDQAPETMLQRVLEAIEELAKTESATMERMSRFLKNIEEDKVLLQRLAQ